MNNNKIFEKVKMKIAISNVQEEDIEMNKSNKNIGKGIGIAACVLVSMAGVTFATNYAVNKFGNNASKGVQTAIENGYISEVNSNYKEANGISVNVNSFVLDDYNFDISFNVKFNENYKIEDMLKMDIFDLKIVNEKGEKVFATRELESEEMQKLYKTEQEAKEKYENYSGSYSESCDKIDDNEIRFNLTATGNEKTFPESKKLIITFNKLRISKWIEDKNEETILSGNWNYEIDVPENMAKTNITNYKLKSISDKNYKFEKAYCSNTAFKIYLNNCSGISWNEKDCVENSKGEKFYPAQRSDGDGEISTNVDGTVKFHNTYNLTNIKYTLSNGTETSDGIVSTGDRITISVNNTSKTYKIVIKGDVNGDGKVTAID